MPTSSFAGSLKTPKVNVSIDMGNPLLNLSVDGFLKIGAVGATRALAEDAYHVVKKGSISRNNVEHAFKNMCKEGAYWGSIAGVYMGTEYGVECIRGTRDWKNAMIAGALTGAIVTAASNKGKDKVVVNAITGGALATASQFLHYHF
ncbi:PREDICTED: outer envelope pore protein 16, chloroplastic [Tarenaya hassleriana]|uniref:outer envelope pore protein 16, chloroplastic n=1 Tax=Tarenaya hassleriana TaxID=28532 RepID=UPI00053C5068|nr:PREDICTED: outer envelope pore protein 16, chloroplastic [Tarenaya hassleriana]